MANILVISAHPDDNLGCAGTLIKLKKSGNQIYEIVLANGDEGFNRSLGVDVQPKKNAMKSIRRAEFLKASKLLGTEKSWFMGFSDFTIHMDKRVMFKIVRIIRKLEPQIIFMQNIFDYGTDHIQASKLSYEAVNIAASKLRPELGKSWRTPIVLTMEGVPAFETPAVLVDISDVFEGKMKVLEAYDSQKDSRMSKFTRGFALHRGALARTEYAEAFGVYPNMPILFTPELFSQFFERKDK